MVSVSAKCCHRLPCCLLFTWSDKLLVHSHYRGCTRAVYLCMGLCHCHSHSHASYLLIVRSHTRLSVPSSPTSTLFSYEPIQSFLITYHCSISSLSFPPLSHLLTQKKPRWKWRRCSKSFGTVQKHLVPQEATVNNLRFLAACSQPEGTGARWCAQLGMQ